MFDREALIAACTAYGQVVRVVIAHVQGSAPREAGAAMLVWADGQSGTIGGGRLEYEIMARARKLTKDTWTRHALGPDLGQCCGGVVDVLSEVYDLPRAKAVPQDVFARGRGPMSPVVKRLLKGAHATSTPRKTEAQDNWLIEPVTPPKRPVWIWGAGHVGRAIIDFLQHLDGYRVTWVDTDLTRFPENRSGDLEQLVAVEPARLMPHAPPDAHHLILTYSHEIDLSLCHAALAHGFATCGLIGSQTKWARFRKRLRGLGHGDAQIDTIMCPIGDPDLGKEPHHIALGVIYALTHSGQAEQTDGKTQA